ncbi:MAG: hypothetical protein VKL59_13070 [Nostocaceae cyanobacterium]|nr:hypothetical protein [Nostocaceae cyanobacterium]
MLATLGQFHEKFIHGVYPILGIGDGAWGMGNGASGMGHQASGMGHGASGIGHGKLMTND